MLLRRLLTRLRRGLLLLALLLTLLAVGHVARRELTVHTGCGREKCKVLDDNVEWGGEEGNWRLACPMASHRASPAGGTRWEQASKQEKKKIGVR